MLAIATSTLTSPRPRPDDEGDNGDDQPCSEGRPENQLAANDTVPCSPHVLHDPWADCGRTQTKFTWAY